MKSGCSRVGVNKKTHTQATLSKDGTTANCLAAKKLATALFAALVAASIASAALTLVRVKARG